MRAPVAPEKVGSVEVAAVVDAGAVADFHAEALRASICPGVGQPVQPARGLLPLSIRLRTSRTMASGD